MDSYPMLDVENALSVVCFLQAVQPLRGCEFSRDVRFKHGDQLIREFAVAKLLDKAPAQLSSKDAADVLYLMHNIEPANSGETVFDGGHAHSGYCQILSWVERSLLGKHRGTP